jgi:endo-1,4-beta-D-glucanase Y
VKDSGTKPSHSKHGWTATAAAALGSLLLVAPGCGGGSNNNNGGGADQGDTGGSSGTGGRAGAGTGGATSAGGGPGSTGGGSGQGSGGGNPDNTGGSGSGSGGGPGDAGGGSPTPVMGGPLAFGRHPMKYPAGTIRPSGDQAQVDEVVRKYYDRWKAAYLKKDCAGGYYLFSAGGAGPSADKFLTTSEAHGYAMIAFALMNGYDPESHDIFDNLLTMMQKYPSHNTADLMAWGIDYMCKTVIGNDSASDGDLDMAYALLIAEKIWGNAGKYDYGALAKRVITAVKAGDMNPETHLSKLGDYVTAGDTSFYYTRASDFMVDHYRAFSRATGDAFWMGTIDAIYKLVDYVQTNDSPQTGLIPDFLMNTNTAMPLQVPFTITNGPDLAEDLHSDYDYNSCRVPWRLASDYVVSGDAKVKARLAKINAFIQKQTGGDPSKIIDGYSLAGEPWVASNPPRMINGMAEYPRENGCFTASFGTGAIVDAANQAWVDAVWNFMQTKDFSKDDEYTNSVTLMNMIVMSGNWWAP